MEALEQAHLEQQGFSPGVASTDLSDPEFGHWATLQWGIAKREALLKWCDWLLERLSTNEPSANGTGSRPQHTNTETGTAAPRPMTP